MIKISDLIAELEKKNPDDEVEAVIVKTDGQVILLYVHQMAKAIGKVLKLFQ